MPPEVKEIAQPTPPPREGLPLLDKDERTKIYASVIKKTPGERVDPDDYTNLNGPRTVTSQREALRLFLPKVNLEVAFGELGRDGDPHIETRRLAYLACNADRLSNGEFDALKTYAAAHQDDKLVQQLVKIAEEKDVTKIRAAFIREYATEKGLALPLADGMKEKGGKKVSHSEIDETLTPSKLVNSSTMPKEEKEAFLKVLHVGIGDEVSKRDKRDVGLAESILVELGYLHDKYEYDKKHAQKKQKKEDPDDRK